MNDTSGFKIIAMDGGAATGKSSTSKAVAARLGLMHVDTGAHYRTLTLALLEIGASPSESAALPEKLAAIRLDTRIEEGSARLSVDGSVPADAAIRSPEVNENVSRFAALQSVRDTLFHYQRGLADLARKEGYAGLIMEGRDIGSVIFPDADYRFFLHADEATRAARRAKEGQTDSIAARDKMDSSRQSAPLTCPEGAIRIDTGPRSLAEVVDEVCRLIAQA